MSRLLKKLTPLLALLLVACAQYPSLSSSEIPSSDTPSSVVSSSESHSSESTLSEISSSEESSSEESSSEITSAESSSSEIPSSESSSSEIVSSEISSSETPSSEASSSEVSSSEVSSSEITSSESSSSEESSSEIVSSEVSSSEISSSEVSSSEISSSEVSSSEESSSELPSSEESSSESSLETSSENSSSSSSGPIEDGKKRYPLSFSAADYSFLSTYYNTGTFGRGMIDDYSFENYRVIKGNKTLVLLPYYEDRTDFEIGGSLTNMQGFLGMNQITLTYQTADNSGELPRLYTSDTLLFEDYIEFPLSTSKKTITIPFAPANYFRIETSEHRLELESFTIMYEKEIIEPDFNFLGSGEDFWRLNPTTYEGELYEGASVSVPIDVVKTGSSYTVKQSKTYTYYSFNYVYSNQNLFDDVSEFAYTDPADLAAFYSAFKTWPANYSEKKNFSKMKTLFGYDARQVSSYTRTDGYATAIPWNSVPGKDFPQYFELDVALGSSYYSGTRGLGRLVCWEYGFDSEGYDSSPVCLYTDDHYVTFSEYLNNGSFAARFNVQETTRTNYVWSAPITLN